MMRKATDSKDLKLKMEDKWVHHWNCYTSANSKLLLNLSQWDACCQWAPNILTLSKQQYLIWDTAFWSTKQQDMLEIWGGLLPPFPLAMCVAFLTLSFVYQTQYVSCSQSENIVRCFMCNLICFWIWLPSWQKLCSKHQAHFLCKIFQF